MGDSVAHILFAGGGTGGHLFPALAVADEIKKREPDTAVLFLGTGGKIEARVVPQRGYEFRTIWISGFQRRLSFDNLLFPLKVLVSLIQSFFVIRRFGPDVVVGTGGYVCGPVLFVASLLNIPTVIHESNSYPGATTRMLASRVTRVYLGFADARRWLKRTGDVIVAGTPTRELLGTIPAAAGREFFGIDEKKKTLLVFGGSLGAASINNAVLEGLAELLGEEIQLIWQTGQNEFERVRTAVGDKEVGWMGAFIDRMEYAFGAADLVICRSGATTLAELTRIGKPAILVPYPHAAGDHQSFNARTLADAGAAVLIPDNEVRQKLNTAVITLLNDPGRLERMSTASASLGKPDAGSTLAAAILELAR